MALGISRFQIQISFLISVFFSVSAYALNPEDEIPGLKKTITNLFEGMKKGDSAMVRKSFSEDTKLFTIIRLKSGEPKVREEKLIDFLKAVGTPHDAVWDEKIISWKFTIDPDLAIVTTDYYFYSGSKFSHCGMNTFQMIKKDSTWKIFQITDTRRTNCIEDPRTATMIKPKPTEARLNNLLDNWHRAAARGDIRLFADLMDPEFIYLGTDKTERWEKETFIAFCKPYFEREQGGWDFKPLSRKLYFSDDYRIAWFEEHLDTWMGVCRGSGVFRYSSQGWKLLHYNLCMTIDNDKVNKVIKVINEK